jgi:hypothetical protein
MTKCVLIVAYEFYPFNTGGSHRPFRLACFLKKEGYEPVVVTADDADLEPTRDPSLNSCLEHERIEVIRIPSRRRGGLSRLSDTYYFNITDDAWGRWKRQAMLRLDELLATRNVLCSIVTVPPFSLVDLMPFLKRANIPVILDLRDAWSQWNVSPYATKLHYKLTLKKERKALADADQILVTSHVTLEDLRRLHGESLGTKLMLVPNSFDELKLATALPSGDEIHIGYVGSFYYDPDRDRLNRSGWWKKKPWQWFQYLPHREEWIYRSPYFVFSAFDALFRRFPEYRKKVQLHIAGSKPLWFDEMVARFSLQSVVQHHGFLNKQEVEEMQNRMHYMLITSSKRHGARDYSIAGKTYDFLANLKPMLAFVTDGAQRDVLSGTGIAHIFDPDDIDSSIELLKRVIDKEVRLTPDMEYINQYRSANVFRPLIQELRKWEAASVRDAQVSK